MESTRAFALLLALAVVAAGQERASGQMAPAVTALAAQATRGGGLALDGAELHLVAYAPGWKPLPVKAEWISAPEIGHGRFTIPSEDGVALFRGRGVWTQGEDGSLHGRIEISCVAAASVQCLAVAANLPIEPPFGPGDGSAAAFDLPLSDGRAARLAFTNSIPYHSQDLRPWGGKWTVRFGETAVSPCVCAPGEKFVWEMTLSAPAGVALALAAPIEIAEGDDWARLDWRPDIIPGSALDFSTLGLQDAPAGKHGHLKAVGGRFEFEGLPGVEQRFYGVNLCFTANYPDHEMADRLVDRLVRAGYNAIRVHHHDGMWGNAFTARCTDGEGMGGAASGRASGNARRDAAPPFVDDDIDRLDYLLAKCFGRGIYVTTDLYVSRKAPWRDIGIDRDGDIPMQLYKTYVGVHDGAFADWCRWSRAFLEHVNPYTGRAYRDEPGLPLISLVNEGPLGMGWDGTGKATDPYVKKAWEEFREDVYKCPQTLNVHKSSLSTNANENLDLRLVDNGEQLKFMDNSTVPSPGTPAFDAFDAWLTRRIFERCSAFVRSLGCRALLTNDNNGPRHGEGEGCTPLYDYVDSHFYVDHPTFIDKPWSLPSKCGNDNLIKCDKPSIFHKGWAKGSSKPYPISEWNIAHPGYYRGMGGILTGALAAEQEWDGLWRFAYSHSRDNLDGGAPCAGYFDCVADPLIAASDRASVCLFLRGDAQGGAASGRADDSAQPASAPPLLLDKERGSMALVTPLTCGGFAEGGRIDAGPLSFEIQCPQTLNVHQSSMSTNESFDLRLMDNGEQLEFVDNSSAVPTTLWASSLDGAPLASSRRILLVHLTDVQGEGAQFADERRRILLRWGEAPLVRVGAAEVALRLDGGAGTTPPSVWSLDTAGGRTGEVPAAFDPATGIIRFRVSTRGPDGRGRIYYEIAR